MGDCGLFARQPGRLDFVDLHRLPIDVAKTAVCTALLQAVLGPLPRTGIRLIAGRGNHSEGGVGVVRPAVVQFLRSELGIKAEVDVGNAGAVWVCTGSLRRWAERAAP